MPSVSYITLRTIVEDLRAENERLREVRRTFTLQLDSIIRSLEMGRYARSGHGDNALQKAYETRDLLEEEHAKAK